MSLTSIDERLKIIRENKQVSSQKIGRLAVMTRDSQEHTAAPIGQEKFIAERRAEISYRGSPCQLEGATERGAF
jgi:hypothetical protein